VSERREGEDSIVASETLRVLANVGALWGVLWRGGDGGRPLDSRG
jgi:hypothetical protein